MLQLFWTGLGFFISPKETFAELNKYSVKILLMYGFAISILSVLSAYFGDVLKQGISPHAVFFLLIPYYIGVFLFNGIILTCLMVFFNKKIKIHRFFGLYLITDFPLVLVLPLSMIGMAFPFISAVMQILVFIVFTFSFILKLKLFEDTFKLTVAQILVLWCLPVVLAAFWGIGSLMFVFNKLAVFF
ncbi:MAG: hypothetical protein ACRCTQ_04935 [Brevinemataceae bacterium]